VRTKSRAPLSERDAATPAISRALIILPEPLQKILDGWKTWEIRSSGTRIRGPIALIESRSGTVVGTCELIDSIGPLTRAQCRENARKAGNFVAETGSYAWVLQGARRLRTPVPYRHPRGAIIWVRLSPAVARKLGSSLHMVGA
jgi:hypothetical protein